MRKSPNRLIKIFKIHLVVIAIFIIYCNFYGSILNFKEPGSIQDIISPSPQESDLTANKIQVTSKDCQCPRVTGSRANFSENNSNPYFLEKISDLELDEDFGTYPFNLSGYADDNEDPSDNLHWFVNSDNKSLINITNENSSNQQLIIRSVTNAFGEDDIKLWVSDTSGLMAFQILNIKVHPKNDLPTISNLPVLTVHPAKPYSINLEPYIVDYDTPLCQIVIKIKAEDRDREFASIQRNNLQLNFKSTTDFQKNYITLELNDKINTSYAKISINLTNNYPPEQLKNIPNIFLYKGDPLNNILDLDYYFIDPDHSKGSLTYEYLDGEHLTIRINKDNTVDINSNYNWEGTETFVIRCKDPLGAFKEQIVNISIISKHPYFGLLPLPDLQVHYDLEYSFNLSSYIILQDQKIDLTFEIYEFIWNKWVKSSELSNLIVEMNNAKILKINYSEDYLNKTIPVFINISDGISTHFQEFLIKVTSNYPPVLKDWLPDQLLNEDQINYSALDLYEYFSDIENGTLSFSNISENIVLDIKVNALVDISSKPDWFGQELVIIRAYDIAGAVVEDSILVTVNPINDAPMILEIPETNVTQGVVNTFEYMKYISDLDNNVSELIINVDSPYITVAGGFLIIDYPSDLEGEQHFTLVVNDGELSATQEVTLAIIQQNATGETGNNMISPIIFWGIILLLLIMIISLLIIGSLYITRLRAFKFDEVFLIYKDGLMIAHASRSNKTDQDSDIISSMFTAVQDFIHESFNDHESAPDSWALKRLDFGDFKIAIDRGEYIYIAVVFSGYPIRKMLLKIEKLRKAIEKKFTDVLPTWSGDMDQLKHTQEMIEGLLFSTGTVREAEPESEQLESGPPGDDDIGVDDFVIIEDKTDQNH